MNRKRVQRLWREEGLRVPAKRRKRQRLGDSAVCSDRSKAEPLIVDVQRLCPLNGSAKMSSRV